MKREKICPICGTSNSDTYYTDETYGICEEYYSCKECTYFIYQEYSAPIYGIVEGFDNRYLEKIRENNVVIYSRHFREQLM